MPIKTGRWDEKKRADDGHRVLICRSRPRAPAAGEEPWRQWLPCLAPSAALQAALAGRGKDDAGGAARVAPLPWDEFRARYRREMADDEQAREAVAFLAQLVAEGRTVTLLCSASCPREDRCHRSLLRELIEAEAAGLTPPAPAQPASRSPAS
jgi:uncharacterized protein YeaO (DUF488 family)